MYNILRKIVIPSLFSILPKQYSFPHTGMHTRHWEMISEQTGLELGENQSKWTLENLLAAGIREHAECVSQVADLADKELIIERSTDTVEGDCGRLPLRMVEHSSSGLERFWVFIWLSICKQLLSIPATAWAFSVIPIPNKYCERICAS